MSKNTIISLLWLLTLAAVPTQNTTAQGNNPDRGNDKSQLSVQERVVRYAYRKVYTYALAGSIDKNKFVKRVPDEVAVRNSVRFELGNFRIGPIEQIRDVRIFDLTTPPAGEIIQLSPTETLVNDRKKKRVEASFSLTAQWTNGQYSSGMDKNFTLEDVIKTYPDKFSQFESYAVYEVTVFFEGRTRTYRALALFPNINRSVRNHRPEFLDNVVGWGGTITNIFKEFRDPKGFVRVKLKDKALRSEIPAKSDSNSEVTNGQDDKQAVNSPGDKTAVNYSKASYNKKSAWGCLLRDAVWGLDCNCIGASPLLAFTEGSDLGINWQYAGMGVDDGFCLVQPVQPAEGSPGLGGLPYCLPKYTVRPGVSGFRRDNAYHAIGYHYGNVVLSGSCYQDEACNNICRVEEQVPPNVGETEEDTELLWYHQGGLTSSERMDQGGRDEVLKCDRAVAYAFSRCLIIGCSVEAKIAFHAGPAEGSVTFSGGNLWNDGITVANICKNGQ